MLYATEKLASGIIKYNSILLEPHSQAHTDIAPRLLTRQPGDLGLN